MTFKDQDWIVLCFFLCLALIFFMFMTVRSSYLANSYCELLNNQIGLTNNMGELINNAYNTTLSTMDYISSCPYKLSFFGLEKLIE